MSRLTPLQQCVTVSDVGSKAAAGNVTVNAATLGSTEVGSIKTVAGASVQVNAAGILGKSAAGESLKVGAITVATEGDKNTGSISVQATGGNKLDIGALTAKTVSVDLSGYLGGNVGAAGVGKLGTITGQNVTVKGSELGANAIIVDAHQHAKETAATINVTGGLQDDTLTISNKIAVTATDSVTISFNGAGGSDTIVFDTTATDLTGTGSKLTLTSVENLTADKAVTVKAADVTGLTLKITATDTFTVNGTAAGDTIDLSKFTGDSIVINGLVGNDTIKAGAGQHHYRWQGR